MTATRCLARFPLVAIAALAQQAAAQGLRLAEAEVLPRILSHQCETLRDDLISCETFLLLTGEDGTADLVILGDPLSDPDMPPLLVLRDAAWTGAMYGQRPRLEASGTGTVRLLSAQIAIGHSPWEQTVTIAFRDGAYVVAGVTYSTWDRLTAASLSCDVNLRTGSWQIDADDTTRSGDGAAQSIPLADWSADHPLPPVCVDALARWGD